MKKSFSFPLAFTALLAASFLSAACSKSAEDKKSTPVEAAEIDNGTASSAQVASARPTEVLSVTQNELAALNQFLKLRDPSAPTVTMTGSGSPWGGTSWGSQVNATSLFQINIAGAVATTWPSVQSGEGSQLRLRFEIPQQPPLRNYVLALSNRLIQSVEIVEAGVQQNFRVWSLKMHFGGAKYDLQVNGYIYKPATYVTSQQQILMQGKITYIPKPPYVQNTFRLGTFNNVNACAALASAPATLLSQIGCL
jgi:hypothetical protein